MGQKYGATFHLSTLIPQEFHIVINIKICEMGQLPLALSYLLVYYGIIIFKEVLLLSPQELREELRIRNIRNNIVTKHNDLIQKAKANLSVNEYRLICYAASLIKPEDKEFKYYDISVVDYCRVCGIETNAVYKEFYNMQLSFNNNFAIVDTEEEAYILKWFLKIKYMKKEGKLRVLFDDDMKAYLLELKKNFTKYELYNILLLKSKYSVRLYELFKCYEYRHYIEIELEDLKERLFATTYTLFKDFRVRVLDKAMEEINNYTDLNVSYEVKKQSRKVIGISFSIQEKSKLEKSKTYLQVIATLDKQIVGQMSLEDYGL